MRIFAAAAVLGIALWVIFNIIGATEYQPLSFQRPLPTVIAPWFLIAGIISGLVAGGLWLSRRS